MPLSGALFIKDKDKVLVFGQEFLNALVLVKVGIGGDFCVGEIIKNILTSHRAGR